MSQRATPDELRESMASCFRDLQERIAAESEPGADERLANLLTEYVDSCFDKHSKKIATAVDEVVKKTLIEQMEPNIGAAFQAMIAESAPYVAKMAAITAVKAVPMKVVNADLPPQIRDYSVGTIMIALCREHMAIRDEMKLEQQKLKDDLLSMYEYVKSTRALMNEMVAMIGKGGEKVKIFTDQPTSPVGLDVLGDLTGGAFLPPSPHEYRMFEEPGGRACQDLFDEESSLSKAILEHRDKEMHLFTAMADMRAISLIAEDTD